MTRPTPTAFLHAPAPAGLPRIAPALPASWPPPEALLTVRVNGDVTLTKPLLLAVPQLRAGGPVDVVPPIKRGGPWYLDARPTATRRLPRAGVMRFRTVPPSRTHFLTPAPVAAGKSGAQGTAGFRLSLVFALGPEVTGSPGYFELLPVR